MKNKVNLTINKIEYVDIPVEVAKAIEVMLAQYKATPKADTPKATPKAKAKAEAPKVKVYALCEDGKSVTVGNKDAFIPTKVFKGVTYSLKQAGAKWDAGNKVWAFKTKTACKAWCEAQDARA